MCTLTVNAYHDVPRVCAPCVYTSYHYYDYYVLLLLLVVVVVEVL